MCGGTTEEFRGNGLVNRDIPGISASTTLIFVILYICTQPVAASVASTCICYSQGQQSFSNEEDFIVSITTENFPTNSWGYRVTWSATDIVLQCNDVKQNDRQALYARPAHSQRQRKTPNPTEQNMRWLTLVVFHILVYVVLNASGQSLSQSVPVLQRFWSTLGGPSNQWNGQNPCDSSNYVGIQCAADGQHYTIFLSNLNLNGKIIDDIGSLGTLVTSISLDGNVISGSLPNSLCDLTSLFHFSASSTGLTGSIPTCIDNMKALGELFLDSNSLSGSIPSGIGSLSSLQAFTAMSNQLTGGIPTSMQGLTNLTKLMLTGNRLSGSLPSIFSTLTSLSILHLNGNQFTNDPPSSLWSMKSLTELDLSVNQLTGSIPSSIGVMTNLNLLSLNNNGFTMSIPTQLGDLTALFYLNLGYNSLSGTIPSSLLQLANLKVLNLRQNHLSGTIPNFPLLPSLTSMDVSVNSFTAFDNSASISNPQTSPLLSVSMSQNLIVGVAPLIAGNFPNLLSLDVGSNQLISGTCHTNMSAATALLMGGNNLTEIPACVLQMKNLAYLDVGFNQLKTLPTLQLPALNTLSVQSNQIHTELPDFSGISAISTLVLSSCGFTGPIHSSIYNLSSVRTLDLSSNRLNGTVGDFSSLTSLVSLYLNDNSFVGNVSTTFWSLGNLTTINLGDNNVTWGNPTVNPIKTNVQTVTLRNTNVGYVPRTLLTSKSITFLEMPNVGMTDLPDLSGMTSLSTLFLDYNRLSGTIPSFFSNMSSLQTLSLNGNAYTSGLQVFLGPRPPRNLRELRLYYNQISEEIPSTIYPNSLQNLVLANNPMGSTLKKSLGNLTQLVTLDMSVCGLQGKIPGELFALPNVTLINLRGNQLSGDLSWPARSNLQSVDLSSNELGGIVPDFSSWNDLQSIDLHNNNFSGLASPSLPSSLPPSRCLLYQVPFLGCVPIYNGCSFSSSIAACPVPTTTSIGNSIDLSDLYNSSFTLTVNQAQLPTLVSAVTVALLRQYGNFSISSQGFSLAASTFDRSTDSDILVSSLHASAAVPPSILPSAVDGNNIITTYADFLSVFIVSLFTIERNSFEDQDKSYSTYGGVVGVSVYNQLGGEISIENASERINITLGPSSKIPAGTNASCLYWVENSSKWSNRGCDLSISQGNAICSCNHLTNFSVGSLQPANLINDSPAKNISPYLIIVPVVCGVVVVLIVAVVVFLIVRRARRGKNGLLTDLTLKNTSGGEIDFTSMVHQNSKFEIWRGSYGDTTVVAIKKAKEERFHRELVMEATRLKALHHPNIIMFLNQQFSENTALLVVEWMGGGNLKKFLNKCDRLDTLILYNISLQVSKAMMYTAAQGLVHTRLCAERVMLSHDDNDIHVKVGGWSKSVTEGSPSEDSACGYYTAPEVLTEKKQRSSADVYSFGVLLWTIMADGTDFIKPGQVPQADASWDSHLVSVFHHCTRKHHEDRPSFSDVTARIHSFYSHTTTSNFADAKDQDSYGIVHFHEKKCDD
ncbi:putative LRR receptor-like serine/threonine-protein kinase [Planoprotostelium fungivorum]|uniref:Putative LRR receptor-like serine/threonine-protein kinase n=1 Tax=Planoprotostelium fungivorum TaxID=1890364 RepID=A0A2P6N121_9EUKA|nr:putative LRR receptor-like serine/threonine-protein kinase [Planoprotostelium fungivorum]